MADDFHFKHHYCTSTPGDYVQNAAHYDRWMTAHDAGVAEKACADERERAAKDVERMRDAIVKMADAMGIPFNPVQYAALTNAAGQVRSPSRTPDQF